MVKLYNTLSRKVEDFKPIDTQNVRVYSCGPTVYNTTQIGNLMSYIVADTLRRALFMQGYDVTQVINYTDVDDKTIMRSQKEYQELDPNQALEKLTEKYTALFLEDVKKVGNDISAVTFVRATDHIESMKQLITKLYDKGFAYIADDGIYFSIDAYRGSGKTYGQLLKIDIKNTSHARIKNDEYDKESIHDFALWKTQKPGEPAWEFNLGGKNVKGRPGWHIECSAMSRQILGQPFDIHTGGVDLIFPHHENEIAQSTAGEDNPRFATFFMHNEHLLVDGTKMSKSLNNFYTLDDITEKNYHPIAFRLLILQSHYRKQAHFSWENLEAAQNRLHAYQQMADLVFQPRENDGNNAGDFTSRIKAMLGHLGNDLDTPGVLKEISAAAHEAEQYGINDAQRAHFQAFLLFVDKTLGLKLSGRKDITDEQKKIIETRKAARENKDFTKSDELRDELIRQGIGVRDTDRGQVWYRVGVV